MRKWIPPVAIVAAFAFSVAVYPQLPERIPVHWNLEGEPDGWAGGGRGAFVMPAFAAVLWLVMRFLPRIDPRKANYAKFDATYDFFVALIVSLVALLHIVTLGAALGWPVPVERVVPGIIGVAFVMIGNVLPRARPITGTVRSPKLSGALVMSRVAALAPVRQRVSPRTPFGPQMRRPRADGRP